MLELTIRSSCERSMLSYWCYCFTFCCRSRQHNISTYKKYWCDINLSRKTYLHRQKAGPVFYELELVRLSLFYDVVRSRVLNNDNGFQTFRSNPRCWVRRSSYTWIKNATTGSTKYRLEREVWREPNAEKTAFPDWIFHLSMQTFAGQQTISEVSKYLESALVHIEKEKDNSCGEEWYPEASLVGECTSRYFITQIMIEQDWVRVIQKDTEGYWNMIGVGEK